MIRKTIILILILISSATLVSCDYDEKSFNMLDLPEEVTTDFDLPAGIYGKFIYKSLNPEVIKIENNKKALIYQQEEDVIVDLELTINKTTNIYQIKVLKIGSEPLPIEQANMAFDKLTIPKTINEPVELKRNIDNITFKYSSHNQSFLYKDDIVWFNIALSNIPKVVILRVEAHLTDDAATNSPILVRNYEIKQEVMDANNKWLNVISEFSYPLNYKKAITVSENFDLPTRSLSYENVEIAWYSSSTNAISIIKDYKKAYVHANNKETSVILTAVIIIDGLDQAFTFNFIVKE